MFSPKTVQFVDGWYAKWNSYTQVYCVYDKDGSIAGASACSYEELVLLSQDLGTMLVDSTKPLDKVEIIRLKNMAVDLVNV